MSRTTAPRDFGLALLVSVVVVCAVARASGAQTPREPAAPGDGPWAALIVPGGQFTLDTLGVSPGTPRALVLTELIRRLHFANEARGDLEAAIAGLAVAVDDLSRLQRAIASASLSGMPATLETVQSPDARRRFRDALEAAGLRLREVKRRLVVENDVRENATRLRARLKVVGIDADVLRSRLAAGGGLEIDGPSVAVPLPLPLSIWATLIGREIPESKLFVAILTEPAARLLYHGLMALDGETRQWLGANVDLLHLIYRNPHAVRAFALFAPAIRIRGGKLVIPGGALGAQRWSAVLDTDSSHADRFLERLFTRVNGRLAGLYFTIASAEPARQSFLLGSAAAPDDKFSTLAVSFTSCYESEWTAYPFAIRLGDPALLLLEIGMSPQGDATGPRSRRLWSLVFEGDDLHEDPSRTLREASDQGDVDANWLVWTICSAPLEVRSSVLETLLFGSRVFDGVSESVFPDVLIALQARRRYPALMSAVEQAGFTEPSTFAHLARRAQQISRVGDARQAISALQQFQGSVVLTLAAVRARTLSNEAGRRLLDSLAAIPLEHGRYDGRLAAWFAAEWLPAIARSGVLPDNAGESIEEQVIGALSGPSGDGVPITWEGLTYVLDLAADSRRQLREVRRRQEGVTLDSVMALADVAVALRAPALTVERVAPLKAGLTEIRTQLTGFQPAEEFLDDVPDATGVIDKALHDLAGVTQPRRLSTAREVGANLVRLLDVLLGQVLASWAYAPSLGDGAQTLVRGGDPSLRHQFGVRQPDRLPAKASWKIVWRSDAGIFAPGSLFGLDATLARRRLRRLTMDRLPGRPTLTANDLAALQATAALSDPRLLTDASRDKIAAAVAAGTAAVTRADRDIAALQAAADLAGMSPWRKQALSWTVAQGTQSVAGWFSSPELAWIGGLRPDEWPSEIDAWGTAMLPSGCLCLRIPRLRPPDVLLGRPVSGMPPYLAPGLMFRIAVTLQQHRLPAALATAVQRYAMQEVIDGVRPAHAGDVDAFTRAIEQIDPTRIEDYISATAGTGPLVERREE